MCSKPTTTELTRLPTLTGMRWLAAFLVFLYHAACEHLFRSSDIGHSFVMLTAKAGWVGVSFFFVLSGFVLMWSARQGDSLASFWQRRFLKIYPNHVVTFAVAMSLIMWFGPLLPGGSRGSGALANFLLVQNWIPDPYVFISANGVSWSLSCEALFYFTCPIWITLVSRIQPGRLWLVASIVIAAIASVPMLAQLLPYQPLLPWKPFPVWQYWFVYIFPPTRMLEFIFGIVLARIVKEDRWINLSLTTGGLLFVLGYTAAFYVPDLFGFVATTIVPIGLLIGSGAAADLRGLATPFRGRTMLWLGELSFAFYLLHRLVLMYGHLALGRDRQWDMRSTLCFIFTALLLSVGFAATLHAVVEVRFMRAFATRRSKADSLSTLSNAPA